MGRLLALLAALVAAVMIAWTVQQPPKPAGVHAPATAFSAARALSDIQAFAAQPHPIGSAANHAARDYLIGRMTALGLSPQVHAGVGFEQPRWAKGVVIGGDVQNLVGVLPGRDRTAPALALMAHYDSVPGSSGAADDAAGVSSALEVVRAIAARGVPARDVMVVITDGEEAGLLGAHAFFERDPAARHVGFVINMEARGDAGRVQMFQTGARNGGAIRLLQGAADRPQATSLSEFVYEHMPNDTDFTVSRKAGIAGLNFAFAGDQFDYHAASSVPATMDPGTLQDMGQQVLSAARALAFAPALPKAAPDLVYSQVFGDLILAYPPFVGWLILLLAAVLIVVAVVRARRIEAFPWTDVARGAGAALFTAVGAMTVLHFARRATGAHFGYLEQRFLLAQVTRWEIALLLLAAGFLLTAVAEIARGRRQIAFLPLAAGLACSLFGGFDPVGLAMGVVAAVLAVAAYGRPVSRAGGWAGALILLFVVGAIVQVMAAPVAFAFQWPLVLGALAALASDLSERRSVPTLVLLAVIAAATLGWLGGFAHSSFISLDLVELMAVPLLAACAVIWPLAQPAEGAPPERLIGPALIIVGLAVTVAVRVNDPYDARFPQASYVVYEEDQDARRAWFVSATPQLPRWSRQVLTSAGGRIDRFSNWVWQRPVDAAPAPFVAEPAPEITLARQPDGSLVLKAVPPPGAREIALGLQPDTFATLRSIQGARLSMPLAPGARSLVRWDAAPEGGVTLVIRPAGPGHMTVSYNAKLEGWPAGAPPLPPRPRNVMPFNDSDSTYVTGTRTLAW